jgi:hypothetical protein
MQLTESQFNLLMNLIDTKIQCAIQTEIGGEVDNLIARCAELKECLRLQLVE